MYSPHQTPVDQSIHTSRLPFGQLELAKKHIAKSNAFHMKQAQEFVFGQHSVMAP